MFRRTSSIIRRSGVSGHIRARKLIPCPTQLERTPENPLAALTDNCLPALQKHASGIAARRARRPGHIHVAATDEHDEADAYQQTNNVTNPLKRE